MKSFSTIKNLATNLSNNTSSSNDTLMGQLANDAHRYLIQKYFDNERTVTTSTVGSMNLTLTGSVAINAVSATLTAVWAYPTCSQLVNFSSGEQRTVLFTYNSTAITWAVGLTQTATTAIATVGVQYYNIPSNVSKIINDTITIGQLKFTPTPIQSRAEWDLITTLPYSSDIPNYYFLYGGKLGVFPIPSTTGNVLTFNYKTRVPDLSIADYSTGTIATSGMTAGSTTVTGSSTSWNTIGLFPLNTDVTFMNLMLRVSPPNGDGIWYQISQFNSDTSLTLTNPVVNAPNIASGTTYTIGQFPLLQEDFQDLIVYRALKVYFSSIMSDTNKYKEFDALYKEGLELLEAYAGTKSNNVDLGGPVMQMNPNLFSYPTNNS